MQWQATTCVQLVPAAVGGGVRPACRGPWRATWRAAANVDIGSGQTPHFLN